MKSRSLSSLLLTAVVALVAVSCSRKEPPADATQTLQQSFAPAKPEVKQAIEVVNLHLQARDYAAAAQALAPVIVQQRLTEPQKEAVGVALEQFNQAIAADPSLDTKEMYELRARMFQAIRSGPRF